VRDRGSDVPTSREIIEDEVFGSPLSEEAVEEEEAILSDVHKDEELEKQKKEIEEEREKLRKEREELEILRKAYQREMNDQEVQFEQNYVEEGIQTT